MSSVKEMMQCCQSAAFQRPHQGAEQRIRWVVILTVVMMVVEIFAGWLFHSMALLADGFHMATHAVALGIAAVAYGYAKRHASSQRYSFGTGKVGDLGGFASALILGMVSLGIGVESVMRLFQPTDVQFGTATLIAIAGLIVNITSALLLAILLLVGLKSLAWLAQQL